MNNGSIRLLRAEEIECRIASINEKGLSLLLFKDARVDQKILDETFTPFGWKRSHQIIDGNLYCTVEIWDKEKSQWIGKQDVGTMSYAEKEKGQASDSFKRACFNWGIGRELYTAPFIWISAELVNIQKKERESKYFTDERFHVQSINYDEEGNINALSIVNGKNQIVYATDLRKLDFPDKKPDKETSKEKKNKETSTEKKEAAEKTEKEKNTVLNQNQLSALEKELKRTGVALDAVLDRYHLQSAEQMTEKIYGKAMECLKKSKDRQAG